MHLKSDIQLKKSQEKYFQNAKQSRGFYTGEIRKILKSHESEIKNLNLD